MFEFHGMNLKATVKGVNVVELHQIQQKGQVPPEQAPPGRSDKGILIAQTQINFMSAPEGGVKIKASGKR